MLGAPEARVHSSFPIQDKIEFPQLYNFHDPLIWNMKQ